MDKLLHFAESQKNVDLVVTRVGGGLAALATLMALVLFLAQIFTK